MKDFRGSEIKSDFTMFMSKETNQPFEFWHNELSRREIKPWKFSAKSIVDSKLEAIEPFEYRDFVREFRCNPDARPSKNDVMKFMIKEEGHTPESALFKLNLPKIDRIFIDGRIRSSGSNAGFVMKGF